MDNKLNNELLKATSEDEKKGINQRKETQKKNLLTKLFNLLNIMISRSLIQTLN